MDHDIIMIVEVAPVSILTITSGYSFNQPLTFMILCILFLCCCLTELPEVIREMRKEQALYKSKKKTAKGGLRENQVG